MGFSGVAFGLPFAMNSVEGTEASLFVAAAASRASWRRSAVAVGAALVTLVPLGGALWAVFRYFGGHYVDYAIALVVLLLGAREVREGLSERPARTDRLDVGRADHLGLAPASRQSICRFQRDHQLAPTGVIDAATRAAIQAARLERGTSPVDAYVLGVDPADEVAVAAFQRRHGLEVNGDVDASTRGALRVAQQQGFLDPLDVDATRRFQRDHGIEQTGEIDEVTAAALASVRAEGATHVGDGSRVDPAEALAALDVLDADSIRRFQQTLGLRADGVIGPETSGALRALRARLRPDPADVSAIRAARRQHGLSPTAVIDASLRTALASGSPGGAVSEGWLLDPAIPSTIREFQARYGLEQDGVIDEATRQALRFAYDHDCGIDVADPESVRRFQQEHGLRPDGVIGAATQAALATVRSERMARDSKEAERAYGEFADGKAPLIDLDPASAESIRAFQAVHHLEADGVIGPRTQEALAVARQHRVAGGTLVGAHGDEESHGGGPVARVKEAMGEAWPAYVGVVLESSEAMLYSFAVANSTSNLVPAVIGAGAGYVWPWTALPLIRRFTNRLPEWKQETGIGVILVAVAVAFGTLHATGVLA